MNARRRQELAARRERELAALVLLLMIVFAVGLAALGRWYLGAVWMG